MINMPMFMTNRAIPNLYYLVERRNGCVEFISSSEGSEQVVKQHEKQIKKSVVGNTIVNYYHMRPLQDAVEIWVVLCLDIGGSIPDALKR